MLNLSQKEDEVIYTIGRRFPSIRINAKKKKMDKSTKVDCENGSCVRSVVALYAGEKSDGNIYENGHIVIKQKEEERRIRQFKCGKKTFLAVVVLSVMVFLITGAFLLFSSSGM